MRANLDAFWSRRPSTVGNNLQEMQQVMRISNSMRLDHPLETFKRGPFPLSDTFGMAAAIISLQHSLDKGENSKTIQWDTMRGVRSVMSKFVHTTPKGVGGFVMSDGTRSTHITHSNTNTLWFKCFMDGCHERMRDVKVQDTAMTIDVLLGLQETLEQRWLEAQQLQDNNLLFELATLGCAITTGFSSGLRGEDFGHVRLKETILLTTQGLRHARKPHIVLGLEGCFKGQVSRKKHKIPLVRLTRSGIRNEDWLFWLVDQYERNNIVFGPLFCHTIQEQSRAIIQQLDMLLHKYLLALQETKPDLLPENVDVVNKFSFRQSLRRGSTSQARNAKVPKEAINLNNRWRHEESAGNRFAGHGKMIELYTNVLAALETLLQYSEPL
ncbi:hypothetical protein ACA910_011578 [Epithemia clementina (nom. ined.)]